MFFFIIKLQPRLGPKPFSVGSGDVNFDKVFSVPQAPGIDRPTNANNHNNEVITPIQNKSTESSDSSIDEQKDSDEKEGKKKTTTRRLILRFIIDICVFY